MFRLRAYRINRVFFRFRKVFLLVHLFLHSNRFQLSDIFVICFDSYGEKKRERPGCKMIARNLLTFDAVCASIILMRNHCQVWDLLGIYENDKKNNFQEGIYNQLKFEIPSNVFFLAIIILE